MRYPACRFDRGDGLQKTIRTRGQSFKPRVRLRQRHTAAARDGALQVAHRPKGGLFRGGPDLAGPSRKLLQGNSRRTASGEPAAFKERPRPQRLVRRPASGPGPDALRGPAGPEDWCRRPGRAHAAKTGADTGPGWPPARRASRKTAPAPRPAPAHGQQ